MEIVATSVAGVAGLGTCLWYMGDVFRVVYVECLYHVHRISMSKYMDAHVKMMSHCQSIETAVEELGETTIEVVGPFLQ